MKQRPLYVNSLDRGFLLTTGQTYAHIPHQEKGQATVRFSPKPGVTVWPITFNKAGDIPSVGEKVEVDYTELADLEPIKVMEWKHKKK